MKALTVFSATLCAIAVLALITVVTLIAVGTASHPDPSAQDREKKTHQKDPPPQAAQKDFPPKVAHVPDGDIVDDAEAYSRKLLPFLRSHGFEQGTHKERFERQMWLLLEFLPKMAEEAGYHDAAAMHFADLVSDQLRLAGFHWEKL